MGQLLFVDHLYSLWTAPQQFVNSYVEEVGDLRKHSDIRAGDVVFPFGYCLGGYAKSVCQLFLGQPSGFAEFCNAGSNTRHNVCSPFFFHVVNRLWRRKLSCLYHSQNNHKKKASVGCFSQRRVDFYTTDSCKMYIFYFFIIIPYILK